MFILLAIVFFLTTTFGIAAAISMLRGDAQGGRVSGGFLVVSVLIAYYFVSHGLRPPLIYLFLASAACGVFGGIAIRPSKDS